MAFIAHRYPMHGFQTLPWWLWPLIFILLMCILIDCLILITAAIVLLALLDGLLVIVTIRQSKSPWLRPGRNGWGRGLAHPFIRPTQGN